MIPYALLDRVIFLDLVDDRFFALPAELEDSFRAFLDGRPLPASARDALRAEGVIGAASHPWPAIVSAPPMGRRPAGDLTAKRPAPASFYGLLCLAIRFATTRVRLRMKRLPSLLEALTGDAHDTAASTVALALRFRALRAWLPGRDTCLADALTLGAELRRAGAPFRFVIGVSDHPFAAHAWLEAEDLVLTDTAENVLRFTPIVVVECRSTILR